MRVSKAGAKQTPQFLSTHPPLLDRANYLMDYLESFPAEGREFQVDSEEFKKIKARLAPAGAAAGCSRSRSAYER
ncbi:MAG: hypothetical protein ABR530_08425 [Pyrinomonadaceae bacterium]